MYLSQNVFKRYLLTMEFKDEIFHIPSLKFVNDDWNTLVQFLEYEGSPKWSFGEALDLEDNSDVTSLHNLVSVDGFLDLTGTKVTTLGNLKYVKGSVDLSGVKTLTSLGDLEEVDLDLWLSFTNIRSLENLKRVSGNLRLLHCENLKSFGNLEYVGGNLYLHNSKLSKIYTKLKIRKMINVEGMIFF